MVEVFDLLQSRCAIATLLVEQHQDFGRDLVNRLCVMSVGEIVQSWRSLGELDMRRLSA